MGRRLHELQQAIAIEERLGLTKIYNMVNAPNCKDKLIIELRELHREIDVHLCSLFSFQIELGEYDFSRFEDFEQWGPPPSQRIEILQLLLAENQRQQVEGVIEWPAK